MLATRMGVAACRNILQGKSDEMVGLEGRELVSVPLAEVGVKSRQPNLELLEMVKILAK
jgi:6-phosphofructokinase